MTNIQDNIDRRVLKYIDSKKSPYYNSRTKKGISSNLYISNSFVYSKKVKTE